MHFIGMGPNFINILSQIVFYLLFLSLFNSCSEKRTVGFDSELWRSDTNGCLGKRIEIYQDVLDNKKDLLSLANKQLIKILGNPEKVELLQRNQKFFIYNISPGSICAINTNSESISLIIRFNAVGLSSEVFIRNDQVIKDI